MIVRVSWLGWKAFRTWSRAFVPGSMHRDSHIDVCIFVLSGRVDQNSTECGRMACRASRLLVPLSFRPWYPVGSHYGYLNYGYCSHVLCPACWGPTRGCSFLALHTNPRKQIGKCRPLLMLSMYTACFRPWAARRNARRPRCL